MISEQYGSIRFSSVPSYNKVEFENALSGILPKNAKYYGKSLEDQGDQTTVFVLIQLPDASDWGAVMEKLKGGPWRDCGAYVRNLGSLSRQNQLEEWLHYTQDFMDNLNPSVTEAQIQNCTFGNHLLLSCQDPGNREHEE